MHPETAGINNIMGNISISRWGPLHPSNTYTHKAMQKVNNKSANTTLFLLI